MKSAIVSVRAAVPLAVLSFVLITTGVAAQTVTFPMMTSPPVLPYAAAPMMGAGITNVGLSASGIGDYLEWKRSMQLKEQEKVKETPRKAASYRIDDCAASMVRSLVAGEVDRLDSIPSLGGPWPCLPPRRWIDGAAVELRAATGWAAGDDGDEDPPFPIPLPGVGETSRGLVALSAAGFRAVH